MREAMVKTKKCSVCKKELPLTEEFFNKKSRKDGSKDGFRADCRECRNKKRREEYEKNKEKHREYQREWKKNNPEKLKEKALKYARKHNKYTPEELAERRIKALKRKLAKKVKKPIELTNIFNLKKCAKCGMEYPNTKEYYAKRPDSLDGFSRICKNCKNKQIREIRKRKLRVKTNLFKRLSKYEEMRADPENEKLAQIKCAYCGKWINLTNGEAESRLYSINYAGYGESRIYCEGDQCREACPTYGQQFYPKGFKQNSSREVNPLVRQMCMERDNYTCVRCGAHGKGVTLHAHHILSYAKNKMVANDIENVITLCKECHHTIHTTPGCRYHDLRCDAVA